MCARSKKKAIIEHNVRPVQITEQIGDVGGDLEVWTQAALSGGLLNPNSFSSIIVIIIRRETGSKQ